MPSAGPEIGLRAFNQNQTMETPEKKTTTIEETDEQKKTVETTETPAQPATKETRETVEEK